MMTPLCDRTRGLGEACSFHRDRGNFLTNSEALSLPNLTLGLVCVTCVTIVCFDLDAAIGTLASPPPAISCPILVLPGISSAPPSVVHCVVEDCLRTLHGSSTSSRPLHIERKLSPSSEGTIGATRSSPLRAVCRANRIQFVGSASV